MKTMRFARGLGLLSIISQLGLSVLCGAAQPPEKVKYLQLWNKLGSDYEVTHSEVGVPGEKVGDVLYQPCHDGNGFRSAVRTGNRDNPNNFIVFRGLQFAPKGELEMWYKPSWNNASVGHVVDLMYYTTQGWTAADVRLSFAYNDWQERGGLWLADVPGVDGSIFYFYPSVDPQWVVNTPMKITMKWDGALPMGTPKLELFFNDQRPSPYQQAIWGNGGSFVWNQPTDLLVGCRPYPSIWVQHPWEPNVDGVMDELKVWAYTTPPVADAGPDQVGVNQDWVQLDGSASLEYDGESLSYAWELTAKPASSAAVLSGANTVSPSFVADQPGSYVVKLVVSDGHVLSAADTVMVVAQSTAQALEALSGRVADLVAGGTLNGGQGQSLRVKLTHALSKLPTQPAVTINQVRAFINQVTNFVATGVLTATEAAPLLDWADRILVSLGAT
jgi:hypothetical protein